MDSNYKIKYNAEQYKNINDFVTNETFFQKIIKMIFMCCLTPFNVQNL